MILCKSRRTLAAFLSILSAALISFFFCLDAQASSAPVTTEDFQRQAEERKALPVQSNQIENWPAGPAIGAQSAILLEANTGVILYAKNVDERLFPSLPTRFSASSRAAPISEWMWGSPCPWRNVCTVS